MSRDSHFLGSPQSSDGVKIHTGIKTDGLEFLLQIYVCCLYVCHLHDNSPLSYAHLPQPDWWEKRLPGHCHRSIIPSIFSFEQCMFSLMFTSCFQVLFSSSPLKLRNAKEKISYASTLFFLTYSPSASTYIRNPAGIFCIPHLILSLCALQSIFMFCICQLNHTA